MTGWLVRVGLERHGSRWARVLAGARTFREAGERAAELPEELLALAGARAMVGSACQAE